MLKFGFVKPPELSQVVTGLEFDICSILIEMCFETIEGHFCPDPLPILEGFWRTALIYKGKRDELNVSQINTGFLKGLALGSVAQ